jgi:anthranilate phosphoribosyltransferase
VTDAARIFMDVLDGQGTPAQQDVVCANAALALQCAQDLAWPDALAAAQESLLSGRAKASFTTLLNS